MVVGLWYVEDILLMEESQNSSNILYSRLYKVISKVGLKETKKKLRVCFRVNENYRCVSL